MIFYFYGENTYAVKAQVDAITKKYQQKTGGDIEVENFDMFTRPLNELLNTLAVMPMFSSSRLLIVRELASQKLESDKVVELLESIPDTTIAVFIDQKPDKRSNYYKQMSAQKNAKHFMLLPPQQLVSWVKGRVEKHGGSIDNRTISVLIEKVGNDQWQLQSEIAKLAAYNPTISTQSIEDLVVPNLQSSAFAMTDAISRGDGKKATEIYLSLARNNEPDQKILGAIMYQYRTLALAKIGEGNWAKEFGISPYGASKAQQLVRGKSVEDIQKCYQAIIEADMSIKTGQKATSDAMQDLIWKLAGLGDSR